MFVGLAWNCAAELKLFVIALLFLCSLATVLQFIPSRLFLSSSPSAADLRHCLSVPTVSATTVTTATTASSPISTEADVGPPPLSAPAPPPPSFQRDEVVEGGVIKRGFDPRGSAAYSFILMSAYRGGLNTFAVVGLASKPLHVYGRPVYGCEWVPRLHPENATAGAAYKILPDWGYGHVYTAVVVNCTFPSPVGHDGSGGTLVLRASTNGGGDRNLNATDIIEALVEPPGADLSVLSHPPKYDYLYCGSPLYGDLSPQRVREWMAFHVRLFGSRSHFVIYDAGGVHPEVLEALRPWIELGYVTLQDIRDQERFDGYYHNQFVVVNDCLHRYKFMAKWMFFFDLDEFIYVPRSSSLRSVVDSLAGYTQFTIEQMPMSNQLCLSDDAGKTSRKWGFEKLVYKDVKKGIRRDRKYAIQPRNVFATGVHMSQNIAGRSSHKTYGMIKYFHYHGTIAYRREPCRKLLNVTDTVVEGIPYVLDTTMREAAGSVKRFELKMIGSRLQRTRQ